jgi:hypothetical protein
LIPSVTFLGIALSIALEWLLPEYGETWSGSVILAGIGLSFLVIYLINRQNWWAMIPNWWLYHLASIASAWTINRRVIRCDIFLNCSASRQPLIFASTCDNGKTIILHSDYFID